MAANLRVVWHPDFENATVVTNTQHAAMWLGVQLNRSGMAIWKVNLNGETADQVIAAAEEAAFSVEPVDLDSLRSRLKKQKPPDRGENRTQRMIIKEIKP